MSNTTIQRKERLQTETVNVTKDNVIQKLLSLEEVMTVTRNVLNSEVDSVEYSIRPFSDGKLGYLGSHYRLTITATMKRKKPVTFSLFLKTLPYEIPAQMEYVIKIGFFKHEMMFYNTIMPLLRKEYRGELWAPECYKVQENLLIFEELTSKGYSIRDKLFNKTLIKAGLNTIARLHAASFMVEKRLGAPLNRLYPEAFTKRNFDYDQKTQDWFEAGVNFAVAIAERQGYNPDLVRAAFGQSSINDAMKPSCTKTNVINHGDLWGNNLMFNEDIPPKCLFVDYQLLRYSPLAYDVSQFLYLCADRNFRETWESAMLRYYYEMLCEILDIHGVNMTERPAWSEILEGIEEQRLCSLVTAITYYPTILMDEKISAQLLGDPVTYAEYTFQDRTKFVLPIMEKDSVYRRRISEAVIELAEFASKLDQLPKPS